MSEFNAWTGYRKPDQFTTICAGAVEAACFTFLGDGDVSADELSLDALNRIAADAADFGCDNAELIRAAGLDGRRSGQLFWYARNGHGVTFMDEDDNETTRALQAAAEAFGELDLYRADNGEIHFC